MGIRHLAAVLYNTHGLDPTAKLILIAIADHINDETGYCWPSMSTLARLAGIDRRNVARWIDKLEDQGHLIVDRTKRGRSNGYRIPMTPASQVGCDASVIGGVTPAPITSDAGVTRTVKNPKGTRRGPAKADAATPTPPPIHEVLLHLDQYR